MLQVSLRNAKSLYSVNGEVAFGYRFFRPPELVSLEIHMLDENSFTLLQYDT